MWIVYIYFVMFETSTQALIMIVYVTWSGSIPFTRISRKYFHAFSGRSFLTHPWIKVAYAIWGFIVLVNQIISYLIIYLFILYQTNQAERAANLFTEMTRNFTEPTDFTFTGLIRAFSARSGLYIDLHISLRAFYFIFILLFIYEFNISVQISLQLRWILWRKWKDMDGSHLKLIMT